MQFRLIYRGRLPAEGRGSSHAKDKHRIRKEIHRQLRELWRTHPFLRAFVQPTVDQWRLKPVNSPTVPKLDDIFEAKEYGPSLASQMAERFRHEGYDFLPLVGTAFDGVQTSCALDILFLRRDEPGRLVVDGGDIDNRIKVLLDALKSPRLGDGFKAEAPPTEDEVPFFCLLEDDSLISELRVATDRLLTPLEENERDTDVHLVIHCRTVLVRAAPYRDGGASAAFAT